MTEAKRHARNEAILKELHPAFADAILGTLRLLESWGERPRLQDGWRSKAEQEEHFRAGRSKVRWSLHNATGPNGEKHALAVHIYDDDNPLAPGKPYLLKLLAAALENGLTTGALFDLPFTLKERAISLARAHDWEADWKVSWDSLHVEPQGLDEKDAVRGVRTWPTMTPHQKRIATVEDRETGPLGAASTTSPGDSLSNRVRQTRSLPPFDRVIGPDGSMTQLHAYVSYYLGRVAGGDFDRLRSLQPGVASAIMREYPLGVFAATYQMVEDAAREAGIDTNDVDAIFGNFERVHGDWTQPLVSEARRYFREWKVRTR